MKRVIFVAGPYRSPTAWGREQNIRRAEELALSVWRIGAVALCPHAMTRYYEGAAPDSVWLTGDWELLRRCDAVLLVDGWRDSKGTLEEIEVAREKGLPVFELLEDLRAWLAKGETP